MGRAPCCDKANVKRGPWLPEEDELLKSYIENHGTGGNWISLPSKAGLRRCGKSCRLRWLNYLRPDIKHGKFTEEEDRVILGLYNEIGSRWSIIAAKLHGRTDNDVKNHWNTKLKKLLTMKEQNACSEVTSNPDHESYSFAEFLNVKTETHQEPMANMTNMLQGFSGYDSYLNFFHHEPVGYMVPNGMHAPSYASKTTVSPSSVDSELSNVSSSINAGYFSWANGRESGAEENGFLVDMLNYGEGMDDGCHLFQSSLEIGDQKSGGIGKLTSVAAPSFSAMLSDYFYEFKPEGCNESGLIDHY